MSRFSSIVLLSVFLYTTIGYYFVFSFLDVENKIEMSDLLEQNGSVKVLCIQQTDLSNIIFYDDGKEISYYGKMYDVKQKSTNGGKIILSCVQDENETNLLANLDNSIQNNINTKSSSEKKQDNLSKVTLNDYYVNTNNCSLFQSSYKVIYYTSNFSVNTFENSISSPPPKI